MNSASDQSKWKAGAMGALCLTAAFFSGKLWAAGIPSEGTLNYSGTLEDANGNAALQSGSHNVAVRFFNDQIAGKLVCESGPRDLVVDKRGRFNVQLPATCNEAVAANPQLWSEVVVDGASLGRSKLGAVPYAFEAAHASTADTAASATRATKADNATNAESAAHAEHADTATTSESAESWPGFADNTAKNYVRIGNLQIAWGTAKTPADNPYINITLPAPFADMTYVVNATTPQAGSRRAWAMAQIQSASQVRLQYLTVGFERELEYGQTINWSAIGRWK